MLKNNLILLVIKEIIQTINELSKELQHERQKKNEQSQEQKTVLKHSKQNPQIQPPESKNDDERWD